MVTDAEIIAKAAELLRVNGWVQGRYGHEGGAHCGSGALAEATRLLGAASYSSAYQKVVQTINEQYPSIKPGCSIIPFNDKHGRTKEEVLAVFEKAAQS
jgi:hypothetical protein